MKEYKIREYLKKDGYTMVLKNKIDNQEYIQAIKVKWNKVYIRYYKVNENSIELEVDKNILKKLNELNENQPNRICYNDINNIQNNEGVLKKVENDAIKEWGKLFVANKLEGCELFAKVYGDTFALNQMCKIKKLYIGNKDKSELGAQNGMDEITLYCAKDGNLNISIEDIKSDEKIKRTLLHEGIHLVLRRDQYVSGMMMNIDTYDDLGQIKKEEIGRGLNEGLTEWIVDKCGMQGGESYLDLKYIIKELEVAIGPEKVMNLGKGKNIEKLLQMSIQESITFLMKGDNIYNLQHKKTISKENKETLRKELLEAKVDIENILFDTYFKKEFDMLINNDINISKENMKKFYKLYELMSDYKYSLDGFEGSSIDFKEKFYILYNKYYQQILSQISQMKNIKKEDIINLIDASFIEENKIIRPDQRKVFGQIANKISTNNKQDIENLIIYLYQENKLQDLEKYSIKVIKSENGDTNTIYYKDGKALGDLKELNLIKIINGTESKRDQIMDLTLGEDENYDDIIRKFEKIEKDVMSKDKEANIQILNRTILITSKGKESFFVIDKGIVNAELVEDINMNLDKKGNIYKSENMSLVPIKTGFLKKFITSIKEKIHRNSKKHQDIKEELNTSPNVTSYKDTRRKWIEEDLELKNISNTAVKKDINSKRSELENEKEIEK